MNFIKKIYSQQTSAINLILIISSSLIIGLLLKSQNIYLGTIFGIFSLILFWGGLIFIAILLVTKKINEKLGKFGYILVVVGMITIGIYLIPRYPSTPILLLFTLIIALFLLIIGLIIDWKKEVESKKMS